MRGLRITFKTPMKWTIESYDPASKAWSSDHVVEQEILLLFISSEPSGSNWWLTNVSPHNPDRQTSMFLWFHSRFSRGHGRLPDEAEDLEAWRKWNAGIIQKNDSIESIEIVTDDGAIL